MNLNSNDRIFARISLRMEGNRPFASFTDEKVLKNLYGLNYDPKIGHLFLANGTVVTFEDGSKVEVSGFHVSYYGYGEMDDPRKGTNFAHAGDEMQPSNLDLHIYFKKIE